MGLLFAKFCFYAKFTKKKHCASVLKRVAHFYDDKTKINGKGNKVRLL